MSTSSPEEALVPPSDESGALLPGTGEQARRPTQAPRRPGAPCVEGAGKQDGGHCPRGRRRAQPPCAGRQRVGWREHGPGLGTLRRGPPEAGPPSTRRPQHAGPASGNGRRERGRPPPSAPGPRPNVQGAHSPSSLPARPPGLPGEAGVSQSLANQGHSDECHAVLRGGGGEGFSEISRLERHYSQAADRADHAARFPRRDGSEPATSALHAAPTPRAGRAGTGPGDLPTRPGS